MGTPLTNPKAIAEKGEAIYAQKYKEKYEAQYLGKYLAIEVTTETEYVDDSPEGALEKARKAHPDGLCHLIKVGAPGAFRVGYTSNADADWIFQWLWEPLSSDFVSAGHFRGYRQQCANLRR